MNQKTGYTRKLRRFGAVLARAKAPLLREAFAGWDIVSLQSYDADIREGSGHGGMSALIDLVARRRG